MKSGYEPPMGGRDREDREFLAHARTPAKDELGFGRVTNSPVEAVDLIIRSLPSAVRKRLKPV